MNKILLKSKKEFNSFIKDNTGYDPCYGILKVCDREDRKPKNYPCIAVWEIQLNGFGPDMLKYGLVYPDDFESM